MVTDNIRCTPLYFYFFWKKKETPRILNQLLYDVIQISIDYSTICYLSFIYKILYIYLINLEVSSLTNQSPSL